MVESVIATSLSATAAVLVGIPRGRQWLERRYRHARAMYRYIVVTVVLLVIGCLSCFILPAPSVMPYVCICGTVLALGVWAVVVSVNRISPYVTAPGRTVLAVGAHPDDLELACGGTLAKMSDIGYKVFVVVMSHGARGGDGEKRPLEAARAARFMGAYDAAVFDFPDTRLAGHNTEMVATIESLIATVQPDIILTHSSHDQHQDHEAVHLATLRAARARATILCYESPSATRDFNPSVFVDIADYIDVKVSAVNAHQNQVGKPYMTSDRLVGVAAFRGAQARRSFAEGFEPIRLLGSAVGDL